jgi:hypothetical protein
LFLAPATAVLASPEMATELPNASPPAPSLAARYPPAPASAPAGFCWLHVVPDRVNTYAAPAPASLPGAPSTAVFPSPERATETPRPSFATPSLAVNACCCTQTPGPGRVNTYAAPWLACAETVLLPAPTTAVFPSLETPTEAPK